MCFDFYEVAKKVLEENGLFSYSTLDDEPLECDSLTFLSIVISIENDLSISVSEKLLTHYPTTYNEWVQFIEEAVKLNKEENFDEAEEDLDDSEEGF